MFELPEVSATSVNSLPGVFTLTCIRPGCFSLEVRGGILAKLNQLNIGIDAVYERQFIDSVQRLRAFRPVQQQ